MRVLVCGGRDFAGVGYLNRQLSTFHAHTPISWIIEGGATGADRLAREWAKRNRVRVWTFEADWSDLSHPDARIKTRPDGSQYDAEAGPRRNRLMLTEGRPDWCIAFPGGNGTRDMVAQAEAAGVEVLRL